MQLEERIDSLSKEARAHKTSNEAAQMLITELREELKQVKELDLFINSFCGFVGILSGWPSGLRRQTQV